MMAHGVSQGADGVVQYEEVLVLVSAERRHEGLQDVAQVRHELCTRLLLEGGERRARGLLHALVIVEDAF